MKQENGQVAAEVKAADPLAGLSPDDRKLVEQTLKDYPELTAAKAIEMLRAFGGL